MSNLNLMVGDLVIGYDDKPFKWDLIHFESLSKGVCEMDELIRSPIPLKPEILDRIEGVECYEFDNGQPNQYRLGNRLFVIRDGIIVDYASDLPLPHLHTLQQLIRLFTGKEIEI